MKIYLIRENKHYYPIKCSLFSYSRACEVLKLWNQANPRMYFIETLNTEDEPDLADMMVSENEPL